jgi:hypothetical protein
VESFFILMTFPGGGFAMMTSRGREQLKLAVALQRRLPLPAHSAAFPPDFYWDRFCQAASRVNRVQQKSWNAALPVALEELERAGESLVQQLRAIADLAKLQMRPRPRASLREILTDLVGLEDEFSEVRWHLREKTLSVVTDAVVLKGIELGRFEILLEYRNLELTRPYRVIALEPNPAAGDSTTTHPHVRDEDLCEGEGKGPIQKALRQGRFYDFFVLINQILHTYNGDSAYVPMSRWEGTSCLGCGSVVSDDDLISCEECHAEGCADCSNTCSKCYRSLCAGCQDRCGTCGDIFCRNCLSNCSGCSDDYCASCLENGRCEDCQEIDFDEDQETEAEVPAAAEVQPVCVGQAGVDEIPRAD